MKVLIADKTDLVRAGLRTFLTSTQCYADDRKLEITEVEDKESLVREVTECCPDVAIVESVMVQDEMSAELTHMVSRYTDTHWVMLSPESAAKVVLLYVKSHKNFSLLLKTCSREEIQTGLRHAARKQQYICDGALRQLEEIESGVTAGNNVLTQAECIVLALLAQGLGVKEIADLQFRSKHTIRTHKRDIFEKLGVNTTVEAIMEAYKLKIIDPPK